MPRFSPRRDPTPPPHLPAVDAISYILPLAFFIILLPVMMLAPVAAPSQAGCLNGSWQQIATDPTYPRLNCVSGVLPPGVYAVGIEGTILRFDGAEWTQMESGTMDNLYGVWVVADNDVWAVGAELLHYDGVSWSIVEGAPGGRYVIVSDGEVIVADAHEVFRYQEGSWVPTTYKCESWCSPPDWCYDECYTINAIWPKPGGGWLGAGKYHYYATRTGEIIDYAVFYDNGAQVPSFGSYEYEFVDVWTGGGDVYFIDTDGRVFTSSGGAMPALMSPQPPGEVRYLAGGVMYPFGMNEDGRIVSYDGASWTILPDTLDVPPSYYGFGRLWGPLPEYAYGVAGSYLYMYDASGFTLWGNEEGPGDFRLADAWVDETDVVWVAAKKWVYRNDGVEWRRMMEAPEEISALWGRVSWDVTAVDLGGNVIHFDGVSANVLPLAADRLFDITGNYGTKVYTVGEVGEAGGGRIFSRLGMEWSLADTVSAPATAVAVARHDGGPEILLVGTEVGDLYRYVDGNRTLIPDVLQQGAPHNITAIWTDGDDAFITGDGFVAHIDVMSGTVLDVTYVNYRVYDLWGTSAQDVWAVGFWCRIHHFDGADWTLHTEIPYGSYLRALSGAGPCDVVAAGDYGRMFRLEWSVSVDDMLPSVSSLHRNYPNPFNPATTISFEISMPGRVILAVYDVTGRRVRILVNEDRSAGGYREMWDGLDDDGRPAASGVYFYRLTAPGINAAHKMVLVR